MNTPSSLDVKKKGDQDISTGLRGGALRRRRQVGASRTSQQGKQRRKKIRFSLLFTATGGPPTASKAASTEGTYITPTGGGQIVWAAKGKGGCEGFLILIQLEEAGKGIKTLAHAGPELKKTTQGGNRRLVRCDLQVEKGGREPP